MNGYLLLDGNKIIEAGVDAPTGGWTAMHQPVPDMATDPATLVGKFYSPKAKRVYDTYDPRSGNYNSSVPVTEEQLKAIEIESAKTDTEIIACNWMVRFITDLIAVDKITEAQIPSYVTNQLNKYLGEGNYTFTEV
jgi:hypothetical protein